MADTIPRITVPDSEDAATVTVALMHYAHRIAARCTANGDLDHFINELRRTVDLLETVVHDQAQRVAEGQFGPVPTDEEITEELHKWFPGSET